MADSQAVHALAPGRAKNCELSEKILPIPELDEYVQTAKGFNVIATANDRDRGVNDLSSALKCFEEGTGFMSMIASACRRESLRRSI